MPHARALDRSLSLLFIAALKSNSLDAFKRLYDDYSGALYTRIIKMTNDTALSQDILQDAFLKIWQKIGTYDQEKATLFTWMLSICRHEVLDFYRLRRSAKRLTTAEYIKTVAIHHDNPAPTKLEAGYFLSTLSLKDRAVMELIYFQGFTHAQVSHLLAMPEGTVKTRVRTVLKAWRTRIKA